MKSKISIFKRQAELSYPISAFEANFVLSLSYPCPEEPLWKNPKPEPQNPCSGLIAPAWGAVVYPIGYHWWPRGVPKGIFHKTTLYSHIRFKAVFFTLPSILKHLVKEGRQKNQKISLKGAYKNDPFVHQQLQHSLHCVSNNWNILK